MNMEWARKWLNESFNKGDLAALERLYHPEVQFKDIPLGIDAAGWPGVKAFLGGFFEPSAGKHAFLPDAYLGNAREGVVEWTWHGTMGEADLFQLGMPVKGKSFKVRGNSVFRFDDAGRIVEERDYWDVATVVAQLKA
jgi:steroid delta-isomerase-like uncharacterized protein